MNRALIAVAIYLTLFVGCGKREAEEEEKKPEAAEKQEQKEKDIVELKDESLQLANLQTVVVSAGASNVPVRAVGRVSFDLNNTAKINSTLDGRISKLNYDLGTSVKSGDVLAVIDSPDLLKPLELKAPLEGRVVDRQGTVGELLDKSKSLYTIADLNTLWCIVPVNENDVPAVRVGQPATLRMLAYPDEKFGGNVLLLGDAVDEKTRTIDVRIELKNPDGKLRPGMFATVFLPSDKIENGVFIPDAAVQNVHGQPVVFVEQEHGKYLATKVTLGRQLGEMDEVLDGLSNGVRIVTSGSFVLKTELLKGELEEKD